MFVCFCRYKIYAEGFAWSVSLKYILSCGSMSLIISPLYQDFFSRGLDPLKNYWPIPFDNMCESIKHAVDWGNDHLSEVFIIFFSWFLVITISFFFPQLYYIEKYWLGFICEFETLRS